MGAKLFIRFPKHPHSSELHIGLTWKPCNFIYIPNGFTVKPVLSGHSKMDKTKVLKTNGSLMKVERTAECSLGAFCNAFDLHKVIIGLENQYLVFFLSGRLRQVVLYFYDNILSLRRHH